jgi:hypothetical protein
MILETPNFKVTNIIFESYEHRSKIMKDYIMHERKKLQSGGLEGYE